MAQAKQESEEVPAGFFGGAQKWEFIQGNQPLRRLAGYIYIYIHRQQHTLVLVQANPKP